MTESLTDGWKDRSAGLIIFGAIQILFGVGAVCMLFGMAAASELQSRGSGAAPIPATSLVATVVMYALLAVYFFTVGIGSIRKRRWARALSLVVSALWLFVGIVGVGAVAIMMPHLSAAIRPSAEVAIMTTVMVVTGTIYIAIPLALFPFYRSPHVKATCEARDPVPRWTDRVPVPILALVLMMASAAVSVIACVAYGIAPVFGVVLTGAPAIIVLVAMAALCAFVAVRLYQLKRSAWWTVVLLIVIGIVNAAYTFTRLDLDKLYEQMGIMTPQLRAMHLADLYRDPMLWVLMGVSWLAFLGYVIWTRRFFDVPPPRTRAGDTVAG